MNDLLTAMLISAASIGITVVGISFVFGALSLLAWVLDRLSGTSAKVVGAIGGLLILWVGFAALSYAMLVLG